MIHTDKNYFNDTNFIKMKIVIMRGLFTGGCGGRRSPYNEMEDSTISTLILLTAGLILSGVRDTEKLSERQRETFRKT